MKKNILIVDDEQNILNVMKSMIQRFDVELEVSIANNGVSALELLKVSNIDLLITDIRMPSMDGLVLIMEARKKYPSMKIIAMSGDRNLHLKAAEKFGASYVISKPIEMDELKSAIHEVLS